MIQDNDFIMLKEFFGGQPLAVLATQDSDQPYSSLVALAPTEDLGSFIFATNRHTRKYSNLKRNSHVSLLADNRRNTAADFSQATAISIIGVATEIDCKDGSPDLNLFVQRHPNLRDFATAADSAIFRVTVEAFLVSGFSQVKIITV